MASLAQANILAGGVPGGHNPVSLRREGEGEGGRGGGRGAAMEADGAAPPLTLCGCRTSEPTGWGVCAQARRGRRRAPGCSAAEGGGARRQGHFVPGSIGSGGGRAAPGPAPPGRSRNGAALLGAAAREGRGQGRGRRSPGARLVVRAVGVTVRAVRQSGAPRNGPSAAGCRRNPAFGGGCGLAPRGPAEGERGG